MCDTSSLSHCASKLFQHKPIFLNYKSLKAGHYDSYASLSPDNVNVFFSPTQHKIHYYVPHCVVHKVYITLQQPMLLSHIRQSVVYFCAFSQLIRVCFTLSAREWVDVVTPLIFSLSIYPTAVSKTETRTVSRLFLFCVSEYPLIWDPPAMANDQVTGLGFQNIFFCTQFWLSWNVSSNRKKDDAQTCCKVLNTIHAIRCNLHNLHN